jgi:hypothetical protein
MSYGHTDSLPFFICLFRHACVFKFFLFNSVLTYKNCLWWPCLLMDQNEMNNLYRGPSIDASYQVSYHLAKRFQRKSCFRNQPIRNKNCLWRPCLLMDQNGMSISHRGPSIDASYHVKVHLAHIWKVLYKDYSFCPDPLTNMATTDNSYFWLVDF